jgi:ATP-dependent RNA helicase DHX37/DHR1
VTLICGETGSGKSTQIGQFLKEKNYPYFGKIVITQPRRLATIALASRVAEETHSKLGELVGFQVRHERKDSAATEIKYLTDGILLNEMSSDYLLSSYSVIVIDEAHERKVNTDILIGLLSKLVLTRYQLSQKGKGHPLRLVIMSATMRVQDFQNPQLFDYHVPIINVEARMFPVSTFFEKHTPDDYKAAAVKKCLMIHRKLPDGDVLVFMTGKDEIHEVASLLEQALSSDHVEDSDNEQGMYPEEPSALQPKSHFIHCLYSSLPMH